MDGVNCGHGWHFGGECVSCEHEWEQVWIDPETQALVGPFRCRKCRIVRPEFGAAVDPVGEPDHERPTRVSESSSTRRAPHPQEAETPQDYKAKYHELLFAVSMKHPNETRHETALRYIRKAEVSGGPASSSLQAPPVVK